MGQNAIHLHQTSNPCYHQFTVVRTVLNWLVLWQHTSIWLYTHYSITINKTCIFLSYLLTLIDNRPCSRFSLEVSLLYHTFNCLSRGFSKFFLFFFLNSDGVISHCDNGVLLHIIQTIPLFRNLAQNLLGRRRFGRNIEF